MPQMIVSRKRKTKQTIRRIVNAMNKERLEVNPKTKKIKEMDVVDKLFEIAFEHESIKKLLGN